MSVKNAKPSEEDFLRRLQTELKLVMMEVDLEEVTSREVREVLEERLDMKLVKYRGILDLQMFEIMGQMDAPSLILDYLYLGSEWNASNLEELQQNGVHYILNISREIDNFFTGILHYMNIREWDVEQTNLLKYWEDTHKFINKSRKRGGKTLVHCKMGKSRSASTVIAYLMKEKKWSLQEAFDYTKAKRSVIDPNEGFRRQLETYEGILKASWNRESFERKDGQANKDKDLDEVPEVPEVNTAEDMLALNLGKDFPESGDLPFLHTEQDIEIGSRSADSTEESLPDKLSPEPTGNEAAGVLRKKKFPRLDSNVAESGDYITSDSSDDTDSDCLSSDDDDDDADKTFQPIDTPGIDTDKTRRVVKPKGRRVKSESDKNMLTVDEGNVQGFSREGSVSKFKADESWIKPEQEEKDGDKVEASGQIMEENSQEDDLDTNKKDDAKDDAKDNDKDNAAKTGEMSVPEPDKKTLESKTDDIVGVVEITPDKNEPNTSEKPEDAENEEESASTGDVTISNEDVKGLEPYVKENIPWNLGTVRKQKQDLEEKFGSVASRKSDPLADKDTCIKTEEREQAEINIPVDESIQLAKDTDKTVTQAECVEEKGVEVANDVADTDKPTEDDTSSSDEQKPRRSVYDLEEIDLPEGIVKRTKMEIEERNRTVETENPKSRLHRSSSLKSTRVTPKAKNRDNERRKTCIAILSPTYNRSDSNQSAGGDDLQASLDTDHDSSEIFDPSQSEAFAGLQASDDTEGDVKTQTGTVKIYKYLGEELTVQEGMVRKQTLDIEHKAKETVVHQAVLKSEKQQTEQNSPNTDDSEQSSTKQLSTSPVYESSEPPISADVIEVSVTSESTVTESLVDEDEKGVDDSSLATVGNIKHSLYDKGMTDIDLTLDEKSSKDSGPCTTPVTQRPKTKSRPESCFDSDTLQLIREIGSALMNSPAKSELDESVGDIQEGESLVSHYVKKIERNTNVTKKKVKREIVIIEKEQGEESKASNIPSASLPDHHHAICDSNEIKVEPTKGSPVARRNTFPLSGQPDSSARTNVNITGAKLSPTGNKGVKADTCDSAASHDKDLHLSHHDHDMSTTTADMTGEPLPDNTAGQVSDDRQTETTCPHDTEACSVKSLVGIFLAKSSSSTTPVVTQEPLNIPITADSTKSDVTESSVKTIWSGKSPPRHDQTVIAQIGKVFETTPPKHDPPWLIHDNKSPGAASDTSMSPPKQDTPSPIKLDDSPLGKGARATLGATSPPKFGQTWLGQCSKETSPIKQNRPVLKHRHSEPGFLLSEKSLHMFSKTLGEVGQGDKDVLSDVPEGMSVELRGTSGRPERPKSVGHTRDTSGADVAGNRRAGVRHSQTLSESGEDYQVFSWDGKKIKNKKTYGKSHPLAKLSSEPRSTVESLRSNPFYSTM